MCYAALLGANLVYKLLEKTQSPSSLVHKGGAINDYQGKGQHL